MYKTHTTQAKDQIQGNKHQGGTMLHKYIKGSQQDNKHVFMILTK